MIEHRICRRQNALIPIKDPLLVKFKKGYHFRHEL